MARMSKSDMVFQGLEILRKYSRIMRADQAGCFVALVDSIVGQLETIRQECSCGAMETAQGDSNTAKNMFYTQGGTSKEA